MKISENTNIGLPIKNLIAIIFFICTGLYAFFTIQERLNKLETADTLFSADLLKKAEQEPKNLEMYMLIEHLAGQIESIEKEIELVGIIKYYRSSQRASRYVTKENKWNKSNGNCYCITYVFR